MRRFPPFRGKSEHLSDEVFVGRFSVIQFRDVREDFRVGRVVREGDAYDRFGFETGKEGLNGNGSGTFRENVTKQ